MTETTSSSIATSCIDAAPTISSTKPLTPRERRLLSVLAERGKTSRHDLDRLAGYENTPDGVLNLRRHHGFELPMEKRPLLDRDGRTVRIGYYSLSESDRLKFAALETA